MKTGHETGHRARPRGLRGLLRDGLRSVAFGVLIEEFEEDHRHFARVLADEHARFNALVEEHNEKCRWLNQERIDAAQVRGGGARPRSAHRVQAGAGGVERGARR